MSYVANSPSTATDPTGLMEIKLFTSKARHEGRINPASNANQIGSTWSYYWHADDGAAIQRVSHTGTLKATDINGATHAISWREAYVEAWTKKVGRGRYQYHSTDYHRNGPSSAAQILQRRGGFTFQSRDAERKLFMRFEDGTECEVSSWTYSSDATFELVNGMHRGWNPALGQQFNSRNSFSITRLDVRGASILQNADAPTADEILYPGSTVVPGLAAFPPPFVKQQWQAQDAWRGRWSTGMTRSIHEYDRGDYR